MQLQEDTTSTCVSNCLVKDHNFVSAKLSRKSLILHYFSSVDLCQFRQH